MTEDIWRRFRDRVGMFIDQAVQDADRVCTFDDPDWAKVITIEARYLAEKGPAAYLRYIAQMEETAIRAELDDWLDETLGQ